MANNIPTITWTGASGAKYTYWIYSLPPNFAAEPGNYIFTKRSQENKHKPIYIGETEDLSGRFDDHHKADCISRNGATHICAHKNEDEKSRLEEEADLVANYGPPCNG